VWCIPPSVAMAASYPLYHQISGDDYPLEECSRQYHSEGPLERWIFEHPLPPRYIEVIDGISTRCICDVDKHLRVLDDSIPAVGVLVQIHQITFENGRYMSLLAPRKKYTSRIITVLPHIRRIKRVVLRYKRQIPTINPRLMNKVLHSILWPIPRQIYPHSLHYLVNLRRIPSRLGIASPYAPTRL